MMIVLEQLLKTHVEYVQVVKVAMKLEVIKIVMVIVLVWLNLILAVYVQVVKVAMKLIVI